MDSKNTVNDIVIYQIPIIDDYSVCPFCGKTLVEKFVTCRTIYNRKPRYMMKRLKYCSCCDLYYGTATILTSITQVRDTKIQFQIDTARTEKKKRKIINKYPDIRVESFPVKGLDKNSVKEKSTQRSKEAAATNPSRIRIEKEYSYSIDDHDIVDINRINAANQVSRIYQVPIHIGICPICHGTLQPEYVHAVVIDNERALKIKGDICFRCDALFVEKSKLYPKSKDALQQKQLIDDKYNPRYDAYQSTKLIKDHPSIVLQYWLLRKHELTVISLVSEYNDVSDDEKCYLYKSDVALRLLQADNEVRLFDKTYTIVQKRSNTPRESIEIGSLIPASIEKQPPELNSKSTIFIYRGRFPCNEKHILRDYCGIIDVGHQRTRLFVQYCFHCKKYYIRFDDYSGYLRRYGFFPIITIDDTSKSRFQNRSEQSLLHRLGYNVNQNCGLTSAQRKRILVYALETGILSKREILNHLEMLITDSRNRYDRRSPDPVPSPGR